MMKPVRKPGITARNIGDEILLCGAEEEAIHVLNATAGLIWELCDGEHTIADMERAIRTSFSVVNEKDVRRDVVQTLDVLADKGLLDTTTS
jgi:hypothetical protein